MIGRLSRRSEESGLIPTNGLRAELELRTRLGSVTPDRMSFVERKRELQRQITFYDFMLRSQFVRDMDLDSFGAKYGDDIRMSDNNIIECSRKFSAKDTYRLLFWDMLQQHELCEMEVSQLRNSWSIMTILHQRQVAAQQPIDEKLTNVFLHVQIEDFQADLINGEVPFLTLQIQDFNFQTKQREDQSGFIGLEIGPISMLNLKTTRNPEFVEWKHVVSLWTDDRSRTRSASQEASESSSKEMNVMVSFQMGHCFDRGVRQVNHAEVNIAPISLRLTLDFIEEFSSFITGENIAKLEKIRAKAMHDKQVNKKLLLDHFNPSVSDVSVSVDEQVQDETARLSKLHEKFDQTMAEISRRSQAVAFHRLRVGSVFCLVNFCVGDSRNNFGIPKITNLEITFESKTYTGPLSADQIAHKLKRTYIGAILSQTPQIVSNKIMSFLSSDSTAPHFNVATPGQQDSSNRKNMLLGLRKKKKKRRRSLFGGRQSP